MLGTDTTSQPSPAIPALPSPSGSFPWRHCCLGSLTPSSSLSAARWAVVRNMLLWGFALAVFLGAEFSPLVTPAPCRPMWPRAEQSCQDGASWENAGVSGASATSHPHSSTSPDEPVSFYVQEALKHTSGQSPPLSDCQVSPPLPMLGPTRSIRC